MIPDDQVEEVRLRADIVDIIGEMVALKKAGREYKACCPFHEERTPSFYVVPDKGFYKCFGCGKSGDVFSFIMERLGLDFVEAVKHVAGRSGVEVRETSRQREEEDPNRPFYELNAFARDWFREQLVDPMVGAGARAYLEGRGIDADTAERFGLGYAPDEWRALRDAATKLGLDEDLMVEVGLLGRRERDNEAYDRFRGRIIFPIEGLSGKVIAFGGRVLEGADRKDAPKYLNSPESTIYHKGRNLYGMSWARHAIRREESAVVVEGYMDVVSLAAHGFENVVAPLGTAMTPEQAKLLGRYTQRIFLLFDSDAAGLKATFRAGDVLLEEGLHPAVVTLPTGEDPDSLVRGHGSDALRGHLDDALDVMDRKLQILSEKDFFSSIERTREAVDRLLPTIRAAADPTLRDIYVAKVADRTGVRRETLEAELRKAPSGFARVRSEAPPPPSPSGGRLPKPGGERTLLLLMTKSADYVERAGERLGGEDFVDPAYRAIFQALLDDPELRSPPTSMDPVAAQRLQELLDDPEELAHAGRVFDDAVARVRVATLSRKLQDLDRRIEQAPEDQKLALTEEKARLSRERREMAPDDWTATARRLRTDSNSNP
ncbi:MAG TPA: DNA primase [Longimicrobiales bacterium]|nr:DNA primase [Longimicrobiales bacterium]